MCIGIYVPPGVQHPKKTVLKQCFKKNDDGAGYAVWNGRKKKWHIKKGFMTWNAFWTAFNGEAFKDSQTLFIHFRISTSGKYVGVKPSPACTHPFPIVDGYEDMFKLDFESPNIAMHNGVCGAGDGDASDTMVAINNIIEPLWQQIDKPKIRDIIFDGVEAQKCRWAYAIKDSIYLDGDWIEDKKTKIFYSNKGYEKVVPVIPTSTQHYTRPSYTGMGTNNYTPNITEIESEINYISDTAVMYVLKAGKWDWEVWKAYEDGYYNIEEHQMTSTADTSGLQEVYGADDKLLALVDDKGVVLWSEDELKKEDLDSVTLEQHIKPIHSGEANHLVGYSCQICGVTFADNELAAGDCPTCMGFGFDPEAITATIVDEGLVSYDCDGCGEQYMSLDDLVSGRCPICFGHGIEGPMIGDDTAYSCEKCQVITLDKDLDDGDCPACGQTINKMHDVTTAEVQVCPCCTDHKYLVDTTMHVGDTECMRCGAVFENSCKHKKDIICFNPESAKAHQKNLDTMGGK